MMESELGVLTPTKKERIPAFTYNFQTIDGTIYFWKHGVPQHRLYVKSDGKDIDAPLPSSKIEKISSQGDAIYFIAKTESQRSLYKAVFSRSDGFIISCVRDKLKDEKFIDSSGRVLCRRIIAGRKYVYRLRDDPENDGILVHLTEEEDDFMRIVDIHREMVIYTSCVSVDEDEIGCYKLGDDSCVVDDFPKMAYSQDSSPFVYMRKFLENVLLTLNTQTMQFLPPLTIEGITEFTNVVGVYNGELTANARIDDEYYLITVQLPVEYYTAAVVDVAAAHSMTDFQSEFLTRFELLGVLGEGGFGSVFKAMERTSKKTFAVKRIPVKGSEQELSKALKEAFTLKFVNDRHDGFVRFYHSWIEKPPPEWQMCKDAEIMESLRCDLLNYRNDAVFMYIQMELCTTSLKEVLKKKERDLVQSEKWFTELVRAVSIIHEIGKIHRDLKPDNILIDANGRLKICDFGIVTEKLMVFFFEEIDTTRTGLGTPKYAAPEQMGIFGGKPTSKSDVFTLGLILIELCVYMDEDTSRKVFKDYQQGNANDILEHLEYHNDLVSWLTDMDPSQRPTCSKILRNLRKRSDPEGNDCCIM